MNLRNNSPMLTYILSTPRSGSTVLTALLEKRKGIVCMPESSFPQVLGVISTKERSDPRWLAALYIAGTFPPTPISLQEAEECMHGSDEEVLVNLGMALAKKISRPVEEVTNVVWKTTRTIGLHQGPLATGGKFVIIRRNPLNVFESQFRVSFGRGNRNPLRFAIFNESYQHAFKRIPKHRLYELHYDNLPDELNLLLNFLEVPDKGEWSDGRGAMDLVSEKCSWLTQITQKFENTDIIKRSRINKRSVFMFHVSMKLARPFRSLLGPVRAHFDGKSIESIRQRAHDLLN